MLQINRDQELINFLFDIQYNESDCGSRKDIQLAYTVFHFLLQIYDTLCAYQKKLNIKSGIERFFLKMILGQLRMRKRNHVNKTKKYVQILPTENFSGENSLVMNYYNKRKYLPRRDGRMISTWP